MKVYDNPNHPGYGPVRRLWLMLAQLDLLQYESRYENVYSTDWDRCVAGAMRGSKPLGEAEISRLVLERFLRLARNTL